MLISEDKPFVQYKLSKIEEVQNMGEFTKFTDEIAERYSDYWCESEIPNPKVSIIIAAYNVEDYIEKCLASILKQTLKEIEVIVVNDGSNDLTPEIAKVFQNCDKRFKLINQENKKLGAARNNGWKIARGEYIGFIDSDDWIDLDYYEKLYNAAKKSNSDIALADYIRVGNGRTKKRLNINKELIATSIEDKFDLCQQAKHPCSTNKIYKSDLLKKNNIIFPEGVLCEDKIFTCKAVYYANSIISVSNTYYYYYRRPNSIVKSKNNKFNNDKAAANRAVLDFLRKQNVELKNDTFWAVKSEIRKFGILWYQVKESLKYEKHLLFGTIPVYENSLKRINARFERKRLFKIFKDNYKHKYDVEPFYSNDYNEPSNVDLFTIAFNNAKIIYYQIKLIKKNIKGRYRHIVCDNSNNYDASKEIRNICKDNNITYIRVQIDTPNGYSDAHGQALNWVYKNIIKQRKNNFGFIDHDIFPIKEIHIENYLDNKDLYGYVREAGKIWFLWPAFSFFNFNLVKNKNVNFRKYKLFNLFHYKGADSGSGLWTSVYKNYNRNDIPKVSCEYIDIINNSKAVWENMKTGYEAYIQTNLSQYLDDNRWFHSICGGEWRGGVMQKNEIIYELIDKYLNNTQDVSNDIQ